MKNANILVLSFLQDELWFLDALMILGRSKACVLHEVPEKRNRKVLCYCQKR